MFHLLANVMDQERILLYYTAHNKTYLKLVNHKLIYLKHFGTDTSLFTFHIYVCIFFVSADVTKSM